MNVYYVYDRSGSLVLITPDLAEMKRYSNNGFARRVVVKDMMDLARLGISEDLQAEMFQG